MSAAELNVIDGLELSQAHRELLRPNELSDGHRLPRFFYSVSSWSLAHEIRVAEHFKLAELMTVDCREADLLLHEFPHYVPCGIGLLAGFLEGFRRAADAPVFLSAQMVAIVRPRTNEIRKSARIRGEPQPMFIASEIPISTTKSRSGNMRRLCSR